jgi:hypothetical protein
MDTGMALTWRMPNLSKTGMECLKVNGVWPFGNAEWPKRPADR